MNLTTLNANEETCAISALDDSYTSTSPCKTCTRINKTKDACISLCLRLKAYRLFKPYSHLPEVTNKQIAEHLKVPEYGYDDCLIDGCEREGTDRELCPSHGAAWRLNRISHPKLGKYVKKRQRI